MKRLWPVILVMFMLCLWAAVPVANATPADVEMPSITNIVPADLQMADCIAHCQDSIAPIDSVASGYGDGSGLGMQAAIPKGERYRCCDSMNFIDNSKTTLITAYIDAGSKTSYHPLL